MAESSERSDLFLYGTDQVLVGRIRQVIDSGAWAEVARPEAAAVHVYCMADDDTGLELSRLHRSFRRPIIAVGTAVVCERAAAHGASQFICAGGDLGSDLRRSLCFARAARSTRSTSLLNIAGLMSHLLECIESGVLIFSAEGDLVEINQAGIDLLGVERSEVMGVAFDRVLAINAAECAFGPVFAELQEGELVEREISILNGGREVPISLRCILYACEPSPVVVAMIEDVTVIRRSIEALDFLQFTLEHCGAPLHWVRRDGSLRFVNRAAAEMLGYRVSELIQRSIFDVDRTLDRETFSRGWQLAKRHGRVEFEATHTTKDGAEVPVSLQVVHCEYQGEEYHINVLQDRTAERDLERVQRRMESVLRTLPLSIFTFDLGGRVLGAVGQLHHSVTALPRLSPGTELIAAFADGAVASAVRRATAGEANGIMLHLDDRHFQIHLLPPEDWRLKGAEGVGLIFDVTERTIAEQTLASQDRRLRAAQQSEAMAAIARGVANDFSNILTAILGNADLLKRRIVGNTQAFAYLERMVAAAELGEAVTEQLQSFHRNQLAESETVDVAKALGGMDAIVQSATGRHIKVTWQVDANCGVVELGRGRFEQMLVGLVLGGAEAMPEGGVLIIRCNRDSLDGIDAVKLSVIDQGPLLSPEERARLFTVSQRSGSRNGLGMAYVASVVGEANGRVAVAATPEGGNVVSIHLPTVSVALGQGESTGVVMVLGSSQIGVQIIDWLRDAGLEVIPCRDPAELMIDLHKLREPDLVIADPALPGSSVAVMRLRLASARTKVVWMASPPRDAGLEAQGDPLIADLADRERVVHQLKRILATTGSGRYQKD